MKPSVLLLAGLATGVGLRLLWPNPAAPDVAPPAKAASQPAGAKALAPAPARPRSAPSGPVTTDAELRERAKTILRRIGLSPSEGEPGSGSSSLYVQAPESTLLKSEEYTEASIVATEPLVDEQCAALFVQLGLSPATEDQLRRMLAEMVFAGHEISALARTEEEINAAIPPAEPVKTMEAASDEAYRRRIRTLLGQDDFARFEAYFDTLQARYELQQAFRRVAMLTDPLTPAQRDGLVARRHAAKTGEATPMQPALLTPAQQAIFADWQADEAAQVKLARLARRVPVAFRVAPLYERAGARPPTPLGR